jgi:hypothetical protein
MPERVRLDKGQMRCEMVGADFKASAIYAWAQEETAYICRSTSFSLSSAIASDGFRPFGHALAQFMMVWQR